MINLKKAQRTLWLFGIFKIPMIGFVGPKLIALSDEEIVLKVPYKRRTLNHLKSIYLGALVVGADLAAGFHAFYIGKAMKRNPSLVFKYIKGDFIQRPMGDVYFVSDDGLKVRDMIERSIKNGERITEGIHIKVFTNYPENPIHCADFELGLSLKVK
jgi:hypothetical protein